MQGKNFQPPAPVNCEMPTKYSAILFINLGEYTVELRQYNYNQTIVFQYIFLSHDVTSGSEITPRNKIDKP